MATFGDKMKPGTTLKGNYHLFHLYAVFMYVGGTSRGQGIEQPTGILDTHSCWVEKQAVP